MADLEFSKLMWLRKVNPKKNEMSRSPESFSPHFFISLKKAEQSHFWFRVRRDWILDFILRFKAVHINTAHTKVLEIGCGTGNVSSFLASQGYQVFGCEYYKEALDMAWPGFVKVQGSAYALPFSDESFDIVGLFDVIEHLDNDLDVLREAHRVLTKGGFLVVTVPARNELWSQFDENTFHKRRYSTDTLFSTIKSVPFMPLSVEYMFMMLYLPMKLLRRKPCEDSDPVKISKIINLIMIIYFECERFISRFIRLPIGTSLIAVAKK